MKSKILTILAIVIMTTLAFSLKLYASSINKIDGSMIQAEVSPAKVEYEPTTDGNFIFVNNPEKIKKEHLAENENGYLLYEGEVSGETELYYEHTNMTGGYIYYGIEFINYHQEDLTITMNRFGHSYGYNKKKDEAIDRYLFRTAWEQYYTQSSPKKLIVGGGNILWAFPSSDRNKNNIFEFTTNFIKDNVLAIESGKSFDGVINFTSESAITIRVYAFSKSIYNIPDNTKYKGNTWEYDVGENGEIEYTGTNTGLAKQLSIMTADLSWIIDDNTVGILPVRYGEHKNKSFWVTNGLSNNEYVKSDTIPLNITISPNSSKTIHNNYDLVISPVAKDPRMNGGLPNWANWGVHTNKSITITNTGSETKLVEYFTNVYIDGRTTETGVAFKNEPDEPSFNFGRTSIFNITDTDGNNIFKWHRVEIEKNKGKIISADEHGNIVSKDSEGKIISIDEHGNIVSEDSEEYNGSEIPHQMVYSVIVYPGESVSFNVDFILGGNSSGGIIHFLKASSIEGELPIRVLLDGAKINFSVPPINDNGRIYVPMREIFESVGFRLDWNGATNTITAKNGSTTIVHTIGKNFLTVNGEKKTFDFSSYVVDGRTLMPVRMVAEAISADVQWNNATKTIIITTDNIDITAVKIGDYLVLGKYNNEPIIWRCVDIDENGPLMLSDSILTFKEFDAAGNHPNDPLGNRKEYGSNLWETSNIRSWLNSSESAGNVEWLCGNEPSYVNEKGFLNNDNFTAVEKKAIRTVKLKTMLNPVDKNLGISAKQSSEVYDYCRDNSHLDNVVNCYAQELVEKIFLLDIRQSNVLYEYDTISESVGYYLRTPNPNDSYMYGGSLVGSSFTLDVIVNGSDNYDPPYDGFFCSSEYGIRPAFYLETSNVKLTNGTGTRNSPYHLGN